MIDIHNHSKFSFDSKSEPKEVIKNAIKNGIKIYGFAEHIYLCETSNYSKLKNEMQSYISCIETLKKDFNNIVILHGVEYNHEKNYISKYKELENEFNFDYVINSVHWIDGVDMYKNYFQNKNIDDAYNGYFDEILKSLDAKYKYEIIGHFGVITKIDKSFNELEFFSRYENKITEILKKIIKYGKTLEINTSTSNTSLTIPNQYVLKLYYDLGGRKISFGADAHKEENVAKNILQAIELAKTIGFKQAYYYIKRNEYTINL